MGNMKGEGSFKRHFTAGRQTSLDKPISLKTVRPVHLQTEGRLCAILAFR